MEIQNTDHALGVAARWHARLRAPDCAASERQQFERWLQQSEVNRAAYDQIAGASSAIDAAFANDPRWQQLAERALEQSAAQPDQAVAQEPSRPQARPQPGRQPHPQQWVKRWAPAALAAGTVLAAILVWRQSEVELAEESLAQVLQVESREHAPRQFTLNDGSIVNVDVGSKLRVSIDSTERRIELLEGRALFDVAHDASRPFSVSANGTRTVALGTRFEVKTDSQRTVVTLEQGSVAIGNTGSDMWREQLSPGEQLSIDSNSSRRQKLEVNAADVSSWSKGWLVFRGESLADALREINRYSGKQVLLADASLAELQVAGRFMAGDSEAIVNAIAEILPIRVVDGGNHEIMLFKRYDN